MVLQRFPRLPSVGPSVAPLAVVMVMVMDHPGASWTILESFVSDGQDRR